MSYSKEDLINPGTFYPDQLKMSESFIRNETLSDDPNVWSEAGWRNDVFEPVSECAPSRATTPEAQDDTAYWAAVPLSDDDCAKLTRQRLTDELSAQVPEYTSSQVFNDGSLEDRTLLEIARLHTALYQLESTPAGDLDTFSSTLSDYLPSNAECARILALRETANLEQNTAMTNAGSLALYSADTVETMNTRIAYNTNVATTGEGVPSTPAPTTEGYGDQRADLTLLDETLVHAFVEEISDVVDTVPYYMPRVTLPFIPDGVDPSKVYMLMYDNDGSFGGVYRTWAPFVMQEDGSWQTEFHVSRAKTTSGLWRVCVNNGHESEPYRITRKVYLGEGGYNDNLVVKWD